MKQKPGMKNVCQQRNVNFTSMMITRFLLFVNLLLTFNFLIAKDFPLSDFSYAKVFLFNTNLVSTQNRPDYPIFDGYYSTTKRGNGYLLNNEKTNLILEVVNKMKKEMHQGLSKCFIPRHGIIFYNNQHQPVASMSICFECERLTTWDSDSSYFDKINEYIIFDKKSVEKTSKGFEKIKQIFKQKNIPVFDNENDYLELFPKEIAINKTAMKKQPLTQSAILFSDIIKLLADKSAIITEIETKITAGGDKYKFKKINYKNSSFLFTDDSENPKLVEAKIIGTDIHPVFGIQIGQCIDEINTITNFEIPKEKNQITIDAEDIRLILYFENKTLIQFKINQY